jgi:hypothetical protein
MKNDIELYIMHVIVLVLVFNVVTLFKISWLGMKKN